MKKTDFTILLKSLSYGDVCMLTEDRPDPELNKSHTVLIVGIDQLRDSVLVVDYLSYERSLLVGRPLQALGRGVASLRKALTGEEDKKFQQKADDTAASVQRGISKSTVLAVWVPASWILSLGKLNASPESMLRSLEDTHPAVGFPAKK